MLQRVPEPKPALQAVKRRALRQDVTSALPANDPPQAPEPAWKNKPPATLPTPGTTHWRICEKEGQELSQRPRF
jgi:hypothetical protein